MTFRVRGIAAAAVWLLPAGVSGQPAQAAQAPPLTPQRIFETTCMTCHGNPSVKQAQSPSALRLMPPEAVYDALASGVMHAQARQLADGQRRGVAEYLSGRNLTD